MNLNSAQRIYVCRTDGNCSAGKALERYMRNLNSMDLNSAQRIYVCRADGNCSAGKALERYMRN